MSAVLDVFMYAGEREALEIRVRELAGVVDWHIAVEGELTFQGAPKPVTILQDYPTHKERLMWRTVKAAEYPTEPGEWQTVAWAREAYQRNAMMGADLLSLCQPDTVILLSDVDEIPNRDAIPHSLQPGETGRLCMQHSMYYANLRCVSFGHWHGTRFIRADDLRHTTPQALRGFGVGHKHLPGDRPSGGNHLSFLGGANAIQRKLGAWAHTETNDLNTLENIERALQTLTDWDQGRGAQLVPVPLDDSFPACIREHPERFSVLPVGVPA